MKKIFIFFYALFLIACQGSAYEEELVENYSLRAMDVKSGMSIYYLDDEYLIGIINPTIFAVGYNNDFIIAKQHPENFPEIDRSITNYFIIPLRDKVSKSSEKNVIGPLTKEEFEKKREELGVQQSLTFTKVFEDLE